jgi:hypothetical protein
MLEDLLGKDCLFNKKVYCGDLQVIKSSESLSIHNLE